MVLCVINGIHSLFLIIYTAYLVQVHRNPDAYPNRLRALGRVLHGQVRYQPVVKPVFKKNNCKVDLILVWFARLFVFNRS